MDPNSQNPYQQPGTPQPQVPAQPQVFVGSNPNGAQPPVQSAQPYYASPQPMAQPMAAPVRSGGKNMMIVIIAVVILVLAGGTVLGIQLLGKKSPTTASTGGSSSALATSKNPCQLFTLANAQSVLGSSAATTNTGVSTSTVANVTYSQCTYSNILSDGNLDSLLVAMEAPTNGKQSLADNVYALDSYRDANIPGIGDKAAYDSSTQRLIALKGNVIITVNFTDENGNPILSTDEQVANIMLGNF